MNGITGTIASVKVALRLEEIVEESGIVLEKDGNDRFKGLCPFHDDTDPSFKVYLASQRFKCFGCGKAGDIITFIMLNENLSFKDALARLASRAGLPSPAACKDADLQAHLLRATILNFIADYYHSQLTEEAADWLKRDSGLDRELLDTYLVGYCQGNMEILPAAISALKDFPETDVARALRELGIIAESRNTGQEYEYFSGCIVFPNLVRGSVPYITGRKLGQKRYLHPRRENLDCTHLYLDDGTTHDKAILVEGEKKALAMRQAGFDGRNGRPQSYGVYGVNNFDLEQISQLKPGKEIYLAFDSDDAGLNAAVELARRLGHMARIVTFPNPDGAAKVGADDFLLRNSPKALEELIGQALTYPEYCLSKLPPGILGTELAERLGPVLDFLAQEPPEWAGFFVNRNIKAHFSLKTNEVNLLWSVVRQKRRELHEKTRAEKERAEALSAASVAATASDAMSEDEEAKTMGFLQDQALLYNIERHLGLVGVVGEERIGILVYLIATSRLMEQGLAATLKAQSASGKSHLVDAVVSLMPPEEVLSVTNLSPKALFYLGEDAVRHKLLICTEVAGREAAEYAVRTLISEPFITSAVVVRNPRTGEPETHHFRVNGPVAYLDTTTQFKLNAENATRIFSIYLDEGEEQTRRIMLKQAEKATSRKFAMRRKREEITRLHHNLQRLLKTGLSVVIPYAELLARTFPAKDSRARRDFPKLLNLIRVIAFLHQYQREKRRNGDREYILATTFDYELAYAIALETFRQTVAVLDERSKRLLGKITDGVKAESLSSGESEEEIEFTRRDISKFAGRSTRALISPIRDLQDAGFLLVKEGGKGKGYIYTLNTSGSKEMAPDFDSLITPAELKRRWRNDSGEEQSFSPEES